ncbi:hypothetical protein ACH42_02580 [Endozoicomonas sp. (ex Bugula neritina AB1)]|nr:hypothetical protein ACH42_02580 [Endozoicomonas sp. (ex Bugula neritina AB1)]
METVNIFRTRFDISSALASDMLSRQSIVFLSKGSVIQQENCEPDHLYFILSGICIFHSCESREVFHGLASEGMVVSDVYLLEGGKPMCTVKTLTDCLLVKLDMNKARALYENCGDFKGLILRSMATKLRLHSRVYALQRASDNNGKVARALLLLSEIVGAGTIPITQKQFSVFLGWSRNTTGKSVNDLMNEGVIDAHYGVITILDPMALKMLASSDCNEGEVRC